MSYNLNKLVNLSSLQQLIEKIKKIFVTKEEISNIQTLPEINDEYIGYILKVNNNKKPEWSNSIQEIQNLHLLNLYSKLDTSSESIASINLYADGNATNPLVYFEGEGNTKVILRNIASPTNSRDAVNKKYVDDKTPFYINFSGTTNNNDAACDTSWQSIENAIMDNKLIIGRYITSDGISFILNIDYRADYLHGNFIKFNNLENLEDYLQIKVVMEKNHLSIDFIDNL